MQESRGEEGEKWGLEGRGTDGGKEDLLALKAPPSAPSGLSACFLPSFPPFSSHNVCFGVLHRSPEF